MRHGISALQLAKAFELFGRSKFASNEMQDADDGACVLA